MFPSKFDWRLPIKINILMLQIVGLWPKGAKRYTPDVFKFYATTPSLLIVSSHNFFQTVNIFFVYKDLEALTATIFITCTELLIATKMYFFIQNVGLLKELMESLDGDLFQPRDEKQVELVKPVLKFWKMLYVGYWIMVGATVVFWSIFPFLNNSVKDKELPFMAWYPYNTKITPLYELTYFYQVFTIWYLTLAAINMDTLIAALMMYVGNQCDILCDNIRNLKSPKNEYDVGDSLRIIIRCVKHHREIIQYNAI